MFEVDPERHWIDPAEGGVTNLIQSLNTPLVAAGPHPAENVQSWIVSRQKGPAFDVFVYFHLTESNKAVVYRWDGGSVPPPQLEYVQEEAMSFCESMGFMMDDLGFGNLAPVKRGELVQTLPPFAKDLSLMAKEQAPEEENSKAVKLDPVEEFARARAARAEAGQASTSEFAVPGGGDEMTDVGAFDPATAAPPQDLGGDDMQIEITEIEGLEMIPESDDIAPVVTGVEVDEPPLVTGSIATQQRREATPSNEIDIMDLEALTGKPASRQAPSTDAEISIDDVLADVGPSNGSGSDDLSSQLDDILDGVESSKRGREAEPPLVVGSATQDSDISIELDADPMSMLESLGKPEPSKPAAKAPPPKPAAKPAPSKPAANIMATQAVSVADLFAGEQAPAAKPLQALESAWASDGGTAERKVSSNGKGSHVSLDIVTDELARLLAML